MSTTPQTTLQLARQGNPDAIAALMNRHLEAQGITAQVMQQDGTLRVSLEADQVPNQSDLVAYVKKGITGLELAHIDQLTVIARQPGTDAHAWSEDLSLQPQPAPLGTEFNAASNQDLDLDFDLDGPAFEVRSLDDLDAVLDNGLDGTDLDFDLGFTDSGDVGLASTDDFDLGFDDSPAELNFGETSAATDATDFDLSLTDDDLGFDLGLDDTGAPDTGLDFDLGLTDAAAEPPADLDFDLGFVDTPAEPSADLDFDLGFTDTPADDLSFDLDLDDAVPSTSADAGDLDFDLGADPAADLDLGLDLGVETEATPLNFEPVDLSFDSDTDLAAELDFDPGEAADFDLDFGSVGEADTDLAAGLDLESGEVADFDLDLGAIGEAEEAIADPDEADFALDFTPSDTLASDLDDLWESDNTDAAGPDLGFTATADSSSAWETDSDFPPLDDMAPLGDDLGFTSEVAASGDDLGGLDFEPIPEEFEPEGFETVEFDLTDLSPDDLAQGSFVAETLDAEVLDDGAIATEATAFPDLDFDSDPGLDDLSPELLPSEEVAFEDLGSADILDLSSPDSGVDFSALSPSTPVDDDLDSYLSSGTEALADDQVDWASTDTPEVDLEASDDLDLYASSEEDLTTDPLASFSLESEGTTPDLAWDSGLELAEADGSAFVSDTAPPWGEGDFDPDLALGGSEDAGVDLSNEFDPGLVFDPAAETTGMAEANVFTNDDFTTSASGFVDSEPDLGAAEDDFPFDSTMELDETVEGDFIVPGEFGDDAASLAESPFAQGEGAEPVDLGFDGTDEDFAFESVELGPEDLVPGYRGAGLAAAGLGQEDLGEVGFDDESFDDEGFDDGLFIESASDTNGFIQDPDGLPLASGEPDATDDFIQEFGTDPSTHVSLTPEQFDKDGGVKSSGGSGLPMRLILGLGLGALVLAAGLLLNGLLGRMRQPTPDEPVVTEPVVPAPDSPTPPPAPDSPAPAPAPVAETDFFREAVNAAQTAANQAQTAGTSAQWQAVADSWARAIELMQQVPESDPNYAVAQQKAVEYQPNRNYAQQNADRLP